MAYRLKADLSAALDAWRHSPGLDLLEHARARFGRAVRDAEAAHSYAIGGHLRVTRMRLDERREDLRRIVWIEALSVEGENFLRGWEAELAAWSPEEVSEPTRADWELEVHWLDEASWEDRLPPEFD